MEREIPVCVLENGIDTKTGNNSRSKNNYGVMSDGMER
jgi:hypothetical protein